MEGVNDRVSRYWQVFKLRHQQSVLTAAVLHSLNTLKHTHTHTQQKKGKCMSGVQKLPSPSSYWFIYLSHSLKQVMMLAAAGNGGRGAHQGWV